MMVQKKKITGISLSEEKVNSEIAAAETAKAVLSGNISLIDEIDNLIREINSNKILL